MNLTLTPGPRAGSVWAPGSKSMGHRLLICAAFGCGETLLTCRGLSRDLAATAACLTALGARIEGREPDGLLIGPIETVPKGQVELPCGESAATLRFLLPLAGALGVEARFLREGRLAQRPISPLTEELARHGMRIAEEGAVLHCSGRLRSGEYAISGELSSQFPSGLLLALPHLEGESSLRVSGTPASSSYLTMTEQVLEECGISFQKQGRDYRIPGGQRCAVPPCVTVEGDWSAAAAFLCMGALSPKGVEVKGLNPASLQGDRMIVPILRRFGAELRVAENSVSARAGERRPLRLDGNQTPDLIPVLAALTACAEGDTVIENAGRLRLKESDRLRGCAKLIGDLGGRAEERKDGLLIHGAWHFRGGCVESAGDHRIAMAAAVACCGSEDCVLLRDAACVEKSYPDFWRDWECLEVLRV